MRSLDLPLARSIARLLAVVRCAIGVAASLVPRVAAGTWIGAEGAVRPVGSVFGRALGGRDLALGLAALGATDDASLSRLVALGALADGIDLLTTIASFRLLPAKMRYLVVASTVGAVAAGAAAATSLRAGHPPN